MCMQEVCEKRWEHCESQRAGKPYPSSSDMWLSWKEGGQGHCVSQGRVPVELGICAPRPVSVGKHELGILLTFPILDTDTRPEPALAVSVRATLRNRALIIQCFSFCCYSPCISISVPQHTPELLVGSREQGSFPEFNDNKDPKVFEMSLQVFGLPLSIHLSCIHPVCTILQLAEPAQVSLLSCLLENLSMRKGLKWQQGSW